MAEIELTMKRSNDPTGSEDRFGAYSLQEEEEFEDGMVGGGGWNSKKRRLSIEQVKALEKNFQVENKLEPERKVKLAQDLGLQPRQVAVWFQNRRARWKTKQLERDYCVLKAAYEALKLDHDSLKRDHDVLVAKIEGGSLDRKEEEDEDGSSLPAMKYKDGSSDSDTSVILNEDGNGGISSSPPPPPPPPHESFQHQEMVFMVQEEEDLKILEMEEHDFLDGSSNIFSDEQAPTLSWYCSDQWKWN